MSKPEVVECRLKSAMGTAYNQPQEQGEVVLFQMVR